ncbi:hypothetical protein [Micromonospora sp. NPDC023956]|uniref:hypothetical protein n=1 Tax=Micromonospora sp. NPDC023956 TaxID=3155722 RepID=UPI0033F36D18
MPDIPAALLGTGGPVGILLFVIGLVLTGRLVPRTVHEDRVRDKAEQVVYLQQTLAVRDEQVRVRDEQVQKLLPNSDLTIQLLQGLAREAGRDDLVA